MKQTRVYIIFYYLSNEYLILIFSKIEVNLNISIIW